MDVLFIDHITSIDYNNTKIFLNGKFIGLYYDGPFLFKYLKLLKLNSFININTSISF